MNALALQDPGRLNALPGSRHFDQHAVAAHTSSFVQRDQSVRPLHRRCHVKTQPCIHFGGHATGDHFQDLQTKTHQHLVHDAIEPSPFVLRNSLCQQRCVFGLLNGFENQ